VAVLQRGRVIVAHRLTGHDEAYAAMARLTCGPGQDRQC
jgi:hypothetical protein